MKKTTTTTGTLTEQARSLRIGIMDLNSSALDVLPAGDTRHAVYTTLLDAELALTRALNVLYARGV